MAAYSRAEAIDKVQKLRRLAMSSNTHEAASAGQKAQAIITAYNLPAAVFLVDGGCADDGAAEPNPRILLQNKAKKESLRGLYLSFQKRLAALGCVFCPTCYAYLAADHSHADTVALKEAA